jgi:TRAP-type C4-dicarboxylate transport system substrate-binding protein
MRHSSHHVSRSLVGVTLLAVAVLVPALVPTPAAAQPFKCATATINDVQHEWCKRYVARLEKATHGAIKGQVFPGGQLGPIPRVIEGVQLGTVEAFIVPPDFLIGLDPRFMALTAPYLFESIDHAHRVINDREFLDRFLTIAEPKGITGVSLLVYGPAGIATRTPVRSPEDLKGKKIRINATPIERQIMTQFGATGVPMGINELLAALQQGAVDGVQSGLPIITNFKFYEAAKYHANTHHYYVTSIAIVNKRWLEGLPPNVRQAVVDEGRAIHAELLDVTKQANAAAEATWKERTKDGWIALTPEQRNAFRGRLEPIDAWIAQEHPPVKDLVELLRKKSREYR